MKMAELIKIGLTAFCVLSGCMCTCYSFVYPYIQLSLLCVFVKYEIRYQLEMVLVQGVSAKGIRISKHAIRKISLIKDPEK